MVDFSDMLFHANHPDDELYDTIHIKTVPRWKDSEISGDEYRFSYVAEVIRKGEVIISFSASKMDWLLDGLKWRILTGRQGDNFDNEAFKRTQDKCDQPSCANVATHWFKRIKAYTKQGDELARKPSTYRQFCDNHIRRGDCGLDDADANYEEIPNPKRKES